MTALNSLFEEILLETNNLKKCCHLPISFDEFEKALQTAKTFDDSDNDLIYEDRRYVCDVPETLKKIVNDVEDFSFFSKELIKSTIDKSWEYYDKCSKLVDMYVLKFDFSNNEEREKIFQQLMKEECQKASNLFLVKSKSTKGLHIFFEDFSLLILNSSSYTKETVHHELIHYFQKTMNIWLYDTKINDILENFNFEKIDHILSLKKYDIDTIKVTLAELMFNEREILTTIENIISDVDDLYNTFYNKKMTRFEFKDYVIDSLGTYQKNVFEHELCRNWEKLNLSKKDLHFFILSYILFDGKSVFQDINLALDLKWV